MNRPVAPIQQTIFTQHPPPIGFTYPQQVVQPTAPPFPYHENNIIIDTNYNAFFQPPRYISNQDTTTTIPNTTGDVLLPVLPSPLSIKWKTSINPLYKPYLTWL